MPDESAESTAHSWRLGAAATSSLSEHLRFAAQTAANHALRSFGSQDAGAALWAATSCGIATEAMLKHCLARTSSTLIASGVEHAIRLVRETGAQIELRELRTLTGLEVAKAVRLLHPDHPAGLNPKNVETVLTVRNTAAHLGVVDPDTLAAAMQAMVAVVQSCLTIAEDNDDFWSDDHFALLEELEAAEIERSRLALELKKSAAARLYEQRRHDVPVDQLRTILSALEGASLRFISPPETITYPCPVCGHRGALGRYVTKSDTDFNGSRYPDEHPNGMRYAYPETFSCVVCGLELDEDEIQQESSFDDVFEDEVEPSEDFERALEEWQYEQRAEIQRENRRLETRLWDDR